LGAPQYEDLPEEKIKIGFDPVAYAQATLQGILLLHHHNITGQRTDIISIHDQWPKLLYLPLIERH